MKSKLNFLPSKKRIKQIQESLLSSFPYQKMNYVICTFIKNFNNIYNYNINNWCKYYLNLGFDNIYLYRYENNDYNISYYIEDYIEEQIKKRVHIITINYKNNNYKEYIHNSYSTFYNLFNINFKWCIYIDIFQFIVFENQKNISQLLNNPMSKTYSIIKFKCYTYKKNNLIWNSYKFKINKGIKNGIIKL